MVDLNHNDDNLLERQHIVMDTIMEEEEFDRVVGWLEELSFESEDEHEVLEPATPPPKAFRRGVNDEVSPTDTTFSGASVFDKPYHHLGNSRHFRDDVSDITSFHDYEEKPIKQPVFERKALTLPPSTCLADVNELINKESHPITTPEPNTPRLATVLSCIQCTLASLSCSRSTPSCTRCIRNNAAPSCLLRRRLFPHEIAVARAELCTLPNLLKLKDENEDVWVNKMAAMQELMEAWQKKKDKDNWVLPRVEIETRGGWKGWKREDDAGLGEGLGRLRCEELTVDEVTF
jgi:hypothetical protein